MYQHCICSTVVVWFLIVAVGRAFSTLAVNTANKVSRWKHYVPLPVPLKQQLHVVSNVDYFGNASVYHYPPPPGQSIPELVECYRQSHRGCRRLPSIHSSDNDDHDDGDDTNDNDDANQYEYGGHTSMPKPTDKNNCLLYTSDAADE